MVRKAKVGAADRFTLYHEALASAAKKILMEGFRDDGTEYESDAGLRRGVLFSPRPPRHLGPNAAEWAVLEVELTLSERQLEEFLYPREDGHRIWLIPSSVLNSHISRCSVLRKGGSPLVN